MYVEFRVRERVTIATKGRLQPNNGKPMERNMRHDMPIGTDTRMSVCIHIYIYALMSQL